MSWYARVDVVSDSAMLRITSRNDGTDPVVMALSRGIVTVGALACAVNGSAAPARIKLLNRLGVIYNGWVVILASRFLLTSG